jgi:hypothetical protein
VDIVNIQMVDCENISHQGYKAMIIYLLILGSDKMELIPMKTTGLKG